MKKILLIINILIITSISLISYAVEENNTIEINTNKEQIKKGEEIELNNRYLWDGLEFDPTSYDADKNYSKDLYFSTPYKRDTQIRTKPSDYRLLTTLKEDEVGLYKSDDCGENFILIINDPKVADGIIRFTDDGKLYIGNQYGLFLINTQTNKIEKEYKEFINNPNASVEASTKGVTGLDVVGNVIYVQTWDGIYTLENDTITKITNENYDTRWPQMLTVSKSNPNHMVYEFRGSVTNYFTTLVNVTFDGGDTWRVLTTANNPNYEEWATNKGGYEVSCIDIDSRTGKVWLASGCYGYSTIKPPYQE